VVLESTERWGVVQLREGLKYGKKHIPAPEAVVLNEYEGFRKGRRGQLPVLEGLVVQHYRAMPEPVQGAGRGGTRVLLGREVALVG